MAEALAKVKQDLGPGAVILHTRSLSRGGVLGVGSRRLVEITASGDVGVLHPAAGRAIIGREGGGPRRDSGFRSARALQAEGAAMNRAAGAIGEPAAQSDISAFTSSLQGEMGQLRAMVRELLDRSSGGSGWGSGLCPVPQELHDYYTCLLQNSVADELAREVVVKAKERLNECRAKVYARGCSGQASGGDLPGSRGSSGAGEVTASARWQGLLAKLVPAVLVETIERMVPAPAPIGLDAGGGTRYVALVGPTGVGKTTTIAKLAAHFKLREGRSVGLITIDSYRIAAVDQLKAYADILGVPLEVVLAPEEMAGALGRLRDLDLVLIDTSGRSHKDARRLQELKAFLDAARDAWPCACGCGGGSAGSRKVFRGPDGRFRSRSGQEPGRPPLEVHLVLSCTSHPGQLTEVVASFRALGAERVVFTKVDEAVGLGVIFSLIRRLNLRLSYLTTGQDVPDDIEVGHRRRIAELILDRGRPDVARAGEAAASARSVEHVG